MDFIETWQEESAQGPLSSVFICTSLTLNIGNIGTEKYHLIKILISILTKKSNRNA